MMVETGGDGVCIGHHAVLLRGIGTVPAVLMTRHVGCYACCTGCYVIAESAAGAANIVLV
jgi:hypothetical protein